jgi:hypothetical protein
MNFDTFVFLKTAKATVSPYAASSRANLLIDEGSPRTFITTRQANKFRLWPIRQVPLLLSGFKGISTPSSEPSYYVVYFLLYGLNGERITIRAVVINHGHHCSAISDPLEDPHRAVISSLPHLQLLHLTHPTTTVSKFSVDILIGTNFYWALATKTFMAKVQQLSTVSWNV